MTLEELDALIGPAAVAAAQKLADEAPPLTPEQRAVLAVLLRRKAGQDKQGRSDAA